MPPKRASKPAVAAAPSASRSRSVSSNAASPTTTTAVVAAAAAGDPHVYVPPEYSILFEYVFNPFYTFVAGFYPAWWTPNGITLVGIACTVLASLLFMTDAINPVTNDRATGLPVTAAGFDVLYDLRPTSLRSYDAAHGDANSKASAERAQSAAVALPAPVSAALFSDRAYDAHSFVDANGSNSWVFIVCGLLNWIYIIADNTDGKHARRFKMSSLIGEYLDHGLDTVTALLSCFVVGAAAGERISIGFLLQVGSSIMMVCSHFHHLDKNVFIWGDRLFSVDEAMVLISTYPLVVGLCPSAQTAFLFMTALRFVQVFVVIFAGGVGTNIVKFIAMNPRIVNPRVNPLFLIQIGLIAAMAGLGVFHRGGMLPEVKAESKRIIDTLAPYLNWEGADHFGNFPSATAAGGGGAGGAVAGVADTMPAAVRYLYKGVILLCPPYALRTVGSRVLKLLVTYPATWSITSACVTSTLVHIPISTKCLKEKAMTNYVPLAGAILSVLAFATSPASGMVISVAWHLGQILYNCMKLNARR